MTAPKLATRTIAISLLVAGALFMENLDSTILVTGLPTMAHAFGVPLVDVNLGVTAYVLALAVFIPISGWMADRFGQRRIFATAIAVFTAASAWCAYAHSLPEFTVARVVQGLGGSMMVPVGRLMTVREVPKEHIMRTVAYTVWPSLVAPIIGPPLGGWIVTYFNWRWMFLLNVPVGMVLLIAALLLVKPGKGHAPRPMDWIGFVLVGIACSSLITLMELSSAQSMKPWLVSVFAVLTMGCGIAGWRHLRQSQHPVLDLRTLQVQTFRTTVAGGSWVTTAIFMTPFLLPLMFQVGFGLSPFAAGSLVIAVFAGNLAMKPVTTPLLRRFGFRNVLIWNGVATALALLACAWLWTTTPHWIVLLVLFAGGLGRSMQLTSLTTLCFADLSDHQTSSGSALFAMVRQLNMSVGIGIASMTLRLASLKNGGQPNLHAFHIAFVVVGVMALLSLPSAIALPQDAGDVVAGKQKRQMAKA